MENNLQSSFSDVSEGMTALDSDDSLPDIKKPRLLKARRSKDDGGLTIAGLALRRKEKKREKALRESELEAQAAEVAKDRQALGLDTGDARTVDALGAQVAKDVDIIVNVATRSSNLKGTFVKALKDAAASITAAFEAVKERTSSDEVKKLQHENTCLRRDLDELKIQMAELAKERSAPAVPVPTQIQKNEEEERRASILASVKDMLDRRLSGIEQRLSPAKTACPVAGKTNEDATGTAAPARKPGKRKVTPRKVPVSHIAAEPVTIDEAELVPATRDDDWATVTKRKPKKKKGTKASPSDDAASAPAAQNQRRPKKKSRAKKPRLSTPRRPAVLVELDAYAVEKGVKYEHLMRRAMDTIDLEDLGIKEGLRFRRAATGARLLELEKGQTPDDAKRLAEELQRVLGTMARVVQPKKLASLRVTGLDDSVTKEMVAKAVAKVSECDADNVRIGEIMAGPGGMGAMVLRCPIPVAKALAEAGRLLVGWSSARVKLLEQRPLRCYKCMGIGHTRPTCPFTVDRSGLCYRCGKEGHIARNCTDAPCCAVCTSAGKPASHAMGGRDCRPPKIRRTAGLQPKAPSSKAAEETAVMSS